MSKQVSSLRTRIGVIIVIMLLPSVVLMFGSFNAIRGSSSTFSQIIDEPLDKVLLLKTVQSNILKAELPFNLYLNRGETADREAFIRLTVDIDLNFEKLSKWQAESADETALLTNAQKEWLAAKQLGESLLTTTNIPDNATLISRIDQFGRHLERSATMIDELANKLADEIQHRQFAAQDAEWEAIVILGIVFSLGILLAFLSALSLGQSVIKPIRNLERGLQQFGKGDTSARIDLSTNNEIGNLARAFNTLAERYEHIKTELEYLSVHDNLTGLFDRSKLHEEILAEIERSKRYGRTFSLLLLDIDNFQTVNSDYGRLVGDSVLCSVANKISSTVRPTDIASRYGGDEFGVILYETDKKGASETAQRLYDAIANDPLNIGDGKKLVISISIGIATYPLDADSDSSLFAITEKNLSEIKQSRKAGKKFA